ncbi:hypothetical protein, partial [Streptomyces sp. NPDC002156]
YEPHCQHGGIGPPGQRSEAALRQFSEPCTASFGQGPTRVLGRYGRFLAITIRWTWFVPS